jgi:hypothetical protein
MRDNMLPATLPHLLLAAGAHFMMKNSEFSDP